MAHAYANTGLLMAFLWKTIKDRVTPCDHCGAMPVLRERSNDYALPVLAIVCPNGHAIAEQDPDTSNKPDSKARAAESALLNWNRAHYSYASWRPSVQG